MLQTLIIARFASNWRMLTYLELGLNHILDYRAYDHILFLLALIGNYRWSEWKPVVFLATAFTVGHSITLAMVVSGISLIPAVWVELLIPLTILFTAAGNLVFAKRSSRSWWKYAMAGSFGLIHGMGFAGYLSALLGDGERLIPLLGFNLGVEVGQILFITFILGLNYLVLQFLPNAHGQWSKVVNLLALTVSIHLTIQQWPV